MLTLKGYKRKGIYVIKGVILNDPIANYPKPESRLTLTYISMNKEILKKSRRILCVSGKNPPRSQRTTRRMGRVG